MANRLSSRPRRTGGLSRLASYASGFTFYAVRLTPYLLVLLAFTLRLQSIAFQSLWRDEVDSIRFGVDLSTKLNVALAGGGLQGLIEQLRAVLTQPGFNGPLYFLMLHGWIDLAGQSEFALRFPSLICGVLSIPVIYLVGRRWFNRPIGSIAATLLTFSAYHVWYSQEAKMYTLITLLALLALYCLRRGVEAGRGRYWIGVVVFTSLAMYAHILAALLIPVELVLFVIWWPLSRKRWLAGLMTFAALTVPYVPLAAWQLPLIFQPAETGFGRYSFGEMLSVLGGAYTQGILNVVPEEWSAVTAGLAVTLAAFGLLMRLSTAITIRHSSTLEVQPPDRSDFRLSLSLALLAWLALPFLAIFVVSINRPLFTDRYLIWIMPAYYLLVAAGAYALWQWLRPMAVIGLAALVAVGSLGITAQSTTPYKSDFRSAAHLIEQAIQPGDTIVFQIPYNQYTFDYYFHQPYNFIPGPYTNYPGSHAGYLDTEQAVFRQLDALFRGKQTVWLVASEVSMWDRRDLLRRWLNAHGTLTRASDFAQVQVTRYELIHP